MEQAYEVANSLGAKKIIYHNGYTPRTYTYIEWKENVYNYWNDFMKGKNSMSVTIENVLDEDYELMYDLIKRVKHNNFYVCLDVGHINAYSKYKVNEWIDALSFKLNHIHLHNNYGDKDSHLSISKGNMNIIKILHRLKEVKKDLTVTLEIVDSQELKESLDILVKEEFIKLK